MKCAIRLQQWVVLACKRVQQQTKNVNTYCYNILITVELSSDRLNLINKLIEKNTLWGYLMYCGSQDTLQVFLYWMYTTEMCFNDHEQVPFFNIINQFPSASLDISKSSPKYLYIVDKYSTMYKQHGLCERSTPRL